jgi:hypothetical protein
MTYVALDGQIIEDWTYGRDGEYRRAGGPKIHQGGSRTPAADLRRGDVCPGCGVERSVTDRCLCNS